jgi:general secretion pathway protein A
LNRKTLTRFGLKWNPFSPDQPVEARWRTPKVDHFCWRIAQMAAEGGFAAIFGIPGSGKSVALELLASYLAALADVVVGVLTHPQCGVSDFYREMGHVFGVALSASNRWGGFKALRDRWKAHIDATLYRPILLVDEAQMLQLDVLSELRLLSSTDFDSKAILTVVLCGDDRLVERLRTPELLPLGSRIRARLTMEYTTPEELAELLRHLLEKAGNTSLMTPELITTLASHAMGNYRALMNLAGDLLAAGAKKELTQLDEKLYFEVFAPPQHASVDRNQPKRKGHERP